MIPPNFIELQYDQVLLVKSFMVLERSLSWLGVLALRARGPGFSRQQSSKLGTLAHICNPSSPGGSRRFKVSLSFFEHNGTVGRIRDGFQPRLIALGS